VASICRILAVAWVVLALAPQAYAQQSEPTGMRSPASGSEAAPFISSAGESAPAKRPSIKTNRWQEDWSALADPALRTQPFDSLKYIPLGRSDPHSFLSLGATLRERFEAVNAPRFGLDEFPDDAYLLQRLMIHADLRFYEDLRVFVQLEDVRAIDKQVLGEVDENPLDVRLAFVEYSHQFGQYTFKTRAGRQEFAFDLQRFVSTREGPNVRQSFDAVWANLETGSWRVLGFLSSPVVYERDHVFDDVPRTRLQFHTLRVERRVFGDGELSAYYSYYGEKDTEYLDAKGDEHRHVFDARFAAKALGFDWDVEAMGQLGDVGKATVHAWAVGGRAGYTLPVLPVNTRIGLQFDAASGDDRPGDGKLETFNPLFPNGYYFTLGGFTGHANLLHVKPSLTVKPVKTLTVMAGLGLQWRLTKYDAVYVFPNLPVPNTQGQDGLWTGAYGQLRLDWAAAANVTAALEGVHYQIGDVIRRAGGHNGDYLGVELKLAW